MRLLVTGASVIHSLPVIRALGRLGHTVIAASSHPRAHGLYSHFAKGRFIYPSLHRDPGVFAGAVFGFAKSNGMDRIIPLFEEGLALARYSEETGHSPLLLSSCYDTLMAFHDKRQLVSLAAEAAVAMPRTHLFFPREVAGAPDFSSVPGDFPFPALLKLSQSSGSRGVVPVASAKELPLAWAQLTEETPNGFSNGMPLLQEQMEGPVYSSLAFAWRGVMKGAVVYESLGQYPTRGGIGVIRRQVRCPEVLRATGRLIHAAKYHGVLGLDFLQSPGGEARLIDGNPRLTPGFSLAADAGLDLATLLTSQFEPAPRNMDPSFSPNFHPRARVSEIVAVRWVKELGPWGKLTWAQARPVLRQFSSAKPELYDWGDVKSLLGLAAFGVDGLKSALGLGPRGVHRIAPFQYTDFSWKAPGASPAVPH